jgi:hypothetical protein
VEPAAESWLGRHLQEDPALPAVAQADGVCALEAGLQDRGCQLLDPAMEREAAMIERDGRILRDPGGGPQ